MKKQKIIKFIIEILLSLQIGYIVGILFAMMITGEL